MDPHRAARLAEALREELYELINFELEDPRVGQIDISAIELSPDGRRAIIRILAPEDTADSETTLAALSHAKGFLRRELAMSLGLFRVPELFFESAAPGTAPARVPGLLKRIRRGRPKE